MTLCINSFSYGILFPYTQHTLRNSSSFEINQGSLLLYKVQLTPKFTFTLTFTFKAVYSWCLPQIIRTKTTKCRVDSAHYSLTMKNCKGKL